MKLKLTQKWHSGWYSGLSFASIQDIQLYCDRLDRQYYVVGKKDYVGHIGLGDIRRSGPRREYIREARRDAERLAEELLLDIRDGTRDLMCKYGIGEED